MKPIAHGFLVVGLSWAGMLFCVDAAAKPGDTPAYVRCVNANMVQTARNLGFRTNVRATKAQIRAVQAALEKRCGHLNRSKSKKPARTGRSKAPNYRRLVKRHGNCEQVAYETVYEPCMDAACGMTKKTIRAAADRKDKAALARMFKCSKRKGKRCETKAGGAEKACLAATRR